MSFNFVDNREPSTPAHKFPVVFKVHGDTILFPGQSPCGGYPWTIIHSTNPDNIGNVGVDKSNPYRCTNLGVYISNDIEIEVKVK